MKINEELLYSFGAETKIYKEKEIIFNEGETPSYYFQIEEGGIKLNNYNEDGKEFVHNILGKNQSFGDSLLFIQKNYPLNAVALKDSKIIRMPKEKFHRLLREHPDLSVEMNACLSHRLYYSVIMMQNIASKNPATRIIGLLNYLKSFQDCSDPFSFSIPFTRQQIGDLTGLRVETVIRTLKKMESEKILKIKDRKIMY